MIRIFWVLVLVAVFVWVFIAVVVAAIVVITGVWVNGVSGLLYGYIWIWYKIELD